MSIRLTICLSSSARPGQEVFTQIFICGKFSNSFVLILSASKMYTFLFSFSIFFLICSGVLFFCPGFVETRIPIMSAERKIFFFASVFFLCNSISFFLILKRFSVSKM